MNTIKQYLSGVIFTISLLIGLYSSSLLAASDQEIKQASLAAQSDLFTLAKDPSEGAGEVTLVFFFDYNCPYSRVLDKVINEVYPSNNVKVIYKPLGIIDRFSPDAAKAVIAASKQGKFKLLHDAFMDHQGKINLAVIQNLFANNDDIKTQIDKTRYDQDLKNLDTEAHMYENRVLYEKVKLAGVPSVIGAKLGADKKVVADDVQSFSGVERQDLMYVIFKLKG